MAINEYIYSLDEPISITGNFTTGSTVSIELWLDGVLQTVTSNLCPEIDSTGKYEWSLGNIPVLKGSKVQYHFRMSANLGESFVEGDFIIKNIAGDDGTMPRLYNKSEYIKKI